MARRLYELVGRDDRRFSPYCWRVRLALAHKGLEAAPVPVKFTEKDKIAFSGGKTVPVLVDGDRTVRDSWTIATYLEDAYPDSGSLFGGPEGRALARFVNHWADASLQPALFRVIAADLFQAVDPIDQPYFRQTREARFGRTIEEMHAMRADYAAALKTALAPLRLLLAEQPFISGAKPAFADYVVLGSLQWARMVSAFPVLDGDDVVLAWRGRMLDLFDGLARRAPALEAA